MCSQRRETIFLSNDRYFSLKIFIMKSRKFSRLGKTDSKQCDDSFNKKTDDLSHKYDQKGVKSNASKFGNAEEQTTTSKIVDKASNIFSEAKDTVKSVSSYIQTEETLFSTDN